MKNLTDKFVLILVISQGAFIIFALGMLFAPCKYH